MTQTHEEVDIRLDTPSENGFLRDYEITLGGLVIGSGDLSLERDESKVEISYLKIENEEMRGKGYGTEARKKLMARILEEYDWAKVVFSSVNSIPALKAAIATPIPDGWRRHFLLGRLNEEESDVISRLATTDPQHALSWIEYNHGTVTVNYIRA